VTRKLLLASTALVALLMASVPGQAADPDDTFYKGKQIRVIVSTEAGGAYDTYARVLAARIPDHIPGNPTIVILNMPGASGIRATTYMFTNAARDGTYIAGTHSSVPTAPLTSPDAANFDTTKLTWIGSITSDPYIGYVWHTSPVQSLEEAKTKEVIMGSISVGSAGTDMAIIARDLFGLKFKIVTGYKASNDVKLAMERGEVHGTFANAWSSLKTAQPDWLENHKVKIFIQHGFEPLPELPDVPLFMSLAKTDEEKQILTFMLARQAAAKPYFGPPDVPAERVAILRRAFDETIRDPKFVEAATKAGLTLDGPMTGEQLADLVKKLAATPPEVIKRINAMFDAFQANK
jgi:tripartite-type tricarboxylate transporter receptor subunit TctC